MHPNVLLKQHYGKAALNHNGTTKGPFVLRWVFTHAAFRRGPDNTAATLTFTLHSHCSALVVVQALAERSLYASPPSVCLCIRLPCPTTRARSACLAKSPPRPLLLERCRLTSSHDCKRQQQLTLNLLRGGKKDQCCEAKRIMVDRVEGVL